jgi:ABC-2 type transport system permease protein
MHKTFRLARREYKAAVHTKGFLIGLLLAPILMGGSLIAMALFRDQVDTTDKLIAIIDRSGLVAETLVEAAQVRNGQEIYDADTGKKIKPAYVLEIVQPDDGNPPAQRLALSDRVRARTLHAFVEIGPDVLHPRDKPESSRVAYYSKNALIDEVRRWIAWPTNSRLRELRLAEAGIDEAGLEDLFDMIPVDGLGLVSIDERTGEIKEARHSSEAEAIIGPFVMQMLMFIMVLMGAVPQLNAVMEEKSQRISEVLLGSVTPSQIMGGKVLGGLAVSLTAAAVYVLIGITALTRMGMTDRIPYDILPWFFAFMVTAIVMFGSVMAALGSTCNDAKEAQSLTPLGMFPVFIPMFLIVPVVEHPLSTFATWLSLFPPFTPMLMLLRMSTRAGIPVWQPLAGIGGMIIFTVAAVWAAGRIFRIGILMQGQPPNLGNMIRWILRG